MFLHLKSHDPFNFNVEHSVSQAMNILTILNLVIFVGTSSVVKKNEKDNNVEIFSEMMKSNPRFK